MSKSIVYEFYHTPFSSKTVDCSQKNQNGVEYWIEMEDVLNLYYI